jgi:hypothetical protein
LILAAISHGAGVITLHVIEEMLSRGVEPAEKAGCGQKMSTPAESIERISQMERFLLHHLSRLPVSASLWTDLSPANVVVTAVAVITPHVIELMSRSGVLEMIVCNTREEEPARQARCPCG